MVNPAMSPPDPAPRSYPPFVSLHRRSARGAASAPATTDFAALEAWLLGDAAGWLNGATIDFSGGQAQSLLDHLFTHP